MDNRLILNEDDQSTEDAIGQDVKSYRKIVLQLMDPDTNVQKAGLENIKAFFNAGGYNNIGEVVAGHSPNFVLDFMNSLSEEDAVSHNSLLDALNWTLGRMNRELNLSRDDEYFIKIYNLFQKHDDLWGNDLAEDDGILSIPTLYEYDDYAIATIVDQYRDLVKEDKTDDIDKLKEQIRQKKWNMRSARTSSRNNRTKKLSLKDMSKEELQEIADEVAELLDK